MDYLQAHKDKKKELSDLNTRRDRDNEIVTSYAYTMRGTGKDKEKIADVINVTMNRLKVFKAYVEAALNKADERCFVESDDEKVEKATIKDFIDAGFASANHRLQARGEFLLEPYLDDQACMRGELSALILFQMKPAKDGKEAYLDTNITPWDTRFLTYERDSNDLAWSGYETTKTKGMIESEPWFGKAKIRETGKEAEVLNLWTPKDNIVYIAEKEVFRQPNPFGYPPVCVQKVPIGSMLAGKDSLKYGCESIFFLVRDLIDEYYRCVSVLQTLNFLAIKAATQEFTEGGEAQEPEEIRPGANVPVRAPNAISLVPYGKAERAMILALNEINKAINDGTLARITLGDLPGEMSAVALIQIEQGQGQVYMPRLGARGLLKEQAATMLISQSRELKQSTLEMGTLGHKRTWKISDLEGEYKIRFQYANKSPETDFARLSMARQYKDADLLDELTILTDIMKRDDPEGDFRKLQRQRLRRVSPNLRMYDGLMALAEDYEAGDETAKNEIDIVEAELGVSLDQVLAGNLPQAEAEPTPQRPTIPLLTGGGRSSAQKASDLQRTPVEEEGGE